jgi:hypothetical protein
MCDPCAHRAVLRAVKALAKSPAARCIDPDAAMPWMPMSADALVVRTKSAEEPLRDIEARELRRYVTELERIVGRTLEPVRELVAGWRGTPEALVERVREEVTRLRGDMAKEIAAVARPYAAVMADAGARAGLAALPQSIPAVADMVEFGQANPLAVRAAENTAIRMANTVAQTTARNVAEHVAEGIRTGETIEEMAEWIADEGFSESRATMIARTESAYAYTEGRIEAWKETGVVQGKQWLLSPDACEFCEAAARDFAEKSVGLDDAFYAKDSVLTGTDGGQMTLSYSAVQGPPLHPNCRCDTIATLDPRLFEE